MQDTNDDKYICTHIYMYINSVFGGPTFLHSEWPKKYALSKAHISAKTHIDSFLAAYSKITSSMP